MLNRHVLSPAIDYCLCPAPGLARLLISGQSRRRKTELHGNALLQEVRTLSHTQSNSASKLMLPFSVISGSLPREHVRDQYANGSWDVFNEHVESIGAPTVEQAASRDIGFYFLKPEIIPHRAYGVHRFSKGKSLKEFDVSLAAKQRCPNPSKHENFALQVPKYNARAILESQFLSFKMRVGAMLSSSDKPE